MGADSLLKIVIGYLLKLDEAELCINAKADFSSGPLFAENNHRVFEGDVHLELEMRLRKPSEMGMMAYQNDTSIVGLLHSVEKVRRQAGEKAKR